MKENSIEYKLILETNNAGDMAFIKSILDSEGITYFIQGEYAAPFMYYAVPMRLMVKKDEAANVREILKDIELSSAYEGLNSSDDTDDEN